MRHLEAIERSDFAGLPSPTYSIGFAKAYARAVGLDEVAIGREVREQADASHRPPDYTPFEMQDPKRLPPKGLATAVAIIALLIVIGVGLWYGTNMFQGGGAAAPVETAVSEAPPEPAPTNAPAPIVSGGQVSLVATDLVWLRVYDGSGKVLFEKEMQPGERFDVPADADQPMINVGRPDKLTVSVNGSAVAPLGDGSRAIKDVVISSAALLARGSVDAAPVPSATSTASAGESRGRTSSNDDRKRRSTRNFGKKPKRSSDAEETARANVAAARASAQSPTPPPAAGPGPSTPPNP